MIFSNLISAVAPALVASSLLFSTATSTPLDPLLRRLEAKYGSKLEARQQANIITTGARDGGVQPRLEIRQLQQNADQWNIYILALSKLAEMDQSDRLSYFQIAGIHGRPQVDWDGVSGVTDPGNPGYCTHVSNLFLPWHRPFLALFEQVVIASAKDAANEFSGDQQTKYLDAANSLRIPYWDWAADPGQGSVIPAAVTSPSIQVTTPAGPQTIYNPLYSYRFHPADAGLFFSPFTCLSETTRWPNTEDCSAESRESLAVSEMDNSRIQSRDRLYNLLTQYQQFSNFSNEAWIDDQATPGAFDSIESLHDQVHGSVGGENYGYMSIIDVSAFDPIFWLHHTMIDRTFAMFQAMNPHTYVEPQTQKQGSYTYDRGSVQDVNSPLQPFRADSSGTFWTPATVRDHTVFGYTYNDASGGASAVKTKVNRLYGRSTPSMKRSTPRNHMHARRANTTNLSPDLGLAPPTQDSVAKPDIYPRDYLCNIRAQKNGLDTSYFVHVFLGNPGNDPTKWLAHPDRVGTHAILAMKVPSMAHPVDISGVIPLTTSLEARVAAGQLECLEKEKVIPFLRSNLHWRVTKMDGTAVDRLVIPGFQVSVASSEVVPAAAADDFPKWIGGFTEHSEVTDGLPAGQPACDC